MASHLRLWPMSAFLAAAIGLAAPALSAPPRVVATIKPVHALAASILEGVTEPKLLVEGAASPHVYALKPSGAEALGHADAVVRVSPNLEVFLGKAIQTLPAHARVITLEQAPGLSLLPVRNGSGHAGEHEDRERAGADVHFWLDPLNAIAIARYLDAQFSEIDPENAAQYHANAEKLEAKLSALDVELRAKLAGLSDRPFIVFHDVTQYLERRYGLNGLGAVTLSPERAPGAKRLEAVRATIERAKAICVFSEPEFPPKLLDTLTAGTQARRGVLDEVGAAIPAGPDQYFALMRANAGSLAACLKSEG